MTQLSPSTEMSTVSLVGYAAYGLVPRRVGAGFTQKKCEDAQTHALHLARTTKVWLLLRTLYST